MFRLVISIIVIFIALTTEKFFKINDKVCLWDMEYN